jgi:hypothetical protein
VVDSPIVYGGGCASGLPVVGCLSVVRCLVHTLCLSVVCIGCASPVSFQRALLQGASASAGRVSRLGAPAYAAAVLQQSWSFCQAVVVGFCSSATALGSLYEATAATPVQLFRLWPFPTVGFTCHELLLGLPAPHVGSGDEEPGTDSVRHLFWRAEELGLSAPA